MNNGYCEKHERPYFSAFAVIGDMSAHNAVMKAYMIRLQQHKRIELIYLKQQQ